MENASAFGQFSYEKQAFGRKETQTLRNPNPQPVVLELSRRVLRVTAKVDLLQKRFLYGTTR